MAKKRGNGEGCISKETTGKYKGRYRIVLTWRVGAKVVRRSKSAWKHAEAVAQLEKLKAERDRGIIDVGRLSTGEYLDHWAKLQECEETTREWYKTLIDAYIKPGIGHVPIAKLDSLTAERWWSDFEAGDRTREACYTILTATFDQAIASRKLTFSPFATIAKPRYVPEEINPFTVEETKSILNETKGTRGHIVAVLALMTGMRIGEILGLEWNKISFRGETILIDQQAAEVSGKVTLKKPKTKSSVRTINLTSEVAKSLKEHKAILLQEGNAGSSFVCPSPEGGVWHRGNVRNRWWNPLLKGLGIEHRGIHHARHTFATHALGAGVDVLVVSKTLGHAKPSVTWDIYGHVIKGTEKKAVEAVAKLFA